MNLWTINHSDDWGDPFNFRPERFLDESGSLLPATHPTRRRRVQHFNILEIFSNKTRHSFERQHNKYIWCSFIQFWLFLTLFPALIKFCFYRIVSQMFLYQVLFKEFTCLNYVTFKLHNNVHYIPIFVDLCRLDTVSGPA